jgi:hypothetical protein
MNCARFARILADYHEGEISPEEKAMAEAHLEKCPSCRKLLEVTCGEADILPVGMRENLTRSILELTSGGPACPRVESLLWDFGAGQQPPEESSLIALHLDHCANCRSMAATLGLIQEILPTLAEIDPGESFTQEVVCATSGMRRHRPYMKSRLGAWWNRMVQRPRFALESAYVCTIVLFFIFSPLLPLRHLVFQTFPSKAMDPSAKYVAAVWADAQVSISSQACQLESALVSGTGAVYRIVGRATGRTIGGSSSVLQQSLERVGGWHRKEVENLAEFWNRLSGWVSRNRS